VLLRLAPAPPERRRALLVGATFALLAVAAAQPALERTQGREVRTDAEALVVVDNSRSMAASTLPDGTTRLERAKDVARTVRQRLEDVPTGLATLTDRTLPHVLPTADAALFEAALEKTVGIERPPARDVALQATTLSALADVVQGRYFSPGARRRLLVAITDGDSAPFDIGAVAAALRAGRVQLVLVRVGETNERVYGADGTPEPLFRPSPLAAQTLETLSEATSGAAVSSGEAAAQIADDFLGSGPASSEGVATEVVSLAGVFAAAAIVPLLLLLADGLRSRGSIRSAWPRAATP
jgi:von Willebrand factor type A domain